MQRLYSEVVDRSIARLDKARQAFNLEARGLVQNYLEGYKSFAEEQAENQEDRDDTKNWYRNPYRDTVGFRTSLALCRDRLVNRMSYPRSERWFGTDQLGVRVYCPIPSPLCTELVKYATYEKPLHEIFIMDFLNTFLSTFGFQIWTGDQGALSEDEVRYTMKTFTWYSRNPDLMLDQDVVQGSRVWKETDDQARFYLRDWYSYRTSIEHTSPFRLRHKFSAEAWFMPTMKEAAPGKAWREAVRRVRKENLGK